MDKYDDWNSKNAYPNPYSKFGKTRKEHLLLEHRRYLECKPQNDLDLCKASVVLLTEFK